ncbi:hypothetical protein ACI2IY_04860 [Lysobacter enzymogenes]|uniref:hypothetical protein n=1 Tax=Lysobacter enzymogenes TaxID=69 RepID=UPI001A95BFF5|nr:hypothetical protein [Lysobacter enzymogenes]QQP95441.1 hypothetical protein JHW38_19700 [Lysobacter enzymogenes]
MSKLKHSILALVSAAAICGATSASAASFELWNGSAWVNSGSVTFTGPTTASYIGNSLPCTANFSVSVSGGVAVVTGASFTGSSACNGIVASNFNWGMTPGAAGGYTGANPPFTGAPTLTGPLSSVSISGIRIFLPAPLNVTCPSTTGSGTINGVLESSGSGSNRFVFKGALGPCSVQTQNGGGLSPSTPVRVI